MPANAVYFVMLMGIVYHCAWRERTEDQKVRR